MEMALQKVNYFLFAAKMSQPVYDIVLYGATGFTGGYVLRLMADEPNLNYAIAGRNEDRLRKLLEKIGGEMGECTVIYDAFCMRRYDSNLSHCDAGLA